MKKLSIFFQIATYIALFGWAILVFLPNWKQANDVVMSINVTLLCGLYAYLLFFQKNISDEKYPKGGFSTLGGVINLFKNPKGVLIGWIHYLAFDLMIGIYIKNAANELQISYWWQIPCFILTLMFGPVGLLLFFILKYFLV